MEKDPQEIYQARADIQNFIIQNSTHSEAEIFEWIENHASNFASFFDSIDPTMRERWMLAVQEQDESKKLELVNAFKQYESEIGDSNTTLH